ncbi:uncharacterized protein YwgA [Ancylobacter sp. 3268]|uniref:hypothetical protein n=1 Tax=Ancylobacter sp. 3268 TaxID=2817752 RepID=UPI0028644198|nr:hypothetical protein [Ancylobacter sp. 3268]MDR6954683.1 uncharacterized protein YwgA [Ancylobacter sp. 3268]
MTIELRSLVAAAGGEIVGRIRLQKLVYLLDQLDLGSGFSYAYHHYGPYSAELAEEVGDEVVLGRLDEETRYRRGDGVPYVVYKSTGEEDAAAAAIRRHFGAQLGEMQSCSATVLELAATIHWLAFKEECEDWRGELVRRKTVKTENGRTDQALALLAKLGLSPTA